MQIVVKGSGRRTNNRQSGKGHKKKRGINKIKKTGGKQINIFVFRRLLLKTEYGGDLRFFHAITVSKESGTNKKQSNFSSSGHDGASFINTYIFICITMLSVCDQGMDRSYVERWMC